MMFPITFLIIPVLVVALWCTATVLNIELLVLFVKYPEMRTARSPFLMNLCASNIIYLLSAPLMILESRLETVNILCYILTSYFSFVTALNVYTVAAIAVQRFIELRSRQPEDQARCFLSSLMLVGLWTIAVALVTVENLLTHFYGEVFNCKKLSDFGLPLYRMVMYGVVPGIITIVTEVICRTCPNTYQLEVIESEAAQKRRSRNTKILLALTVVFLFTYFPLYVLTYLLGNGIDGREKTWIQTGFLVVIQISKLNPFFTPIALFVASKQLRELHKKRCYYNCCCCSQISEILCGSNNTSDTKTQDSPACIRETEV